jgi:cell wall integrity and stress response component
MKSTTMASVVFLALAQAFRVSAGTPTINNLVARQSSGTPVGVQVPSSAPLLDAFRSQGCFSSSGNLTKQTLEDGNRNTDGYCNLDVCIPKGYTVAAMRGVDCYCGFAYPPEDTLEDDEMCTYPCPAFRQNACGNMNPQAWSVYNTGVSIDVGFYEPPPESSSTTAAPTNSATNSASSPPQSSTTGAPSDGSEGGEENNDGGDDGPNVVAIVAGIVGGVVAIAAVAAGFWFFLRRRRNAEIEEEHRRNAAVNAFISGAKPPGSSGNISLTDSRLEPGLGARRMSDGSIADNQDYSRKILRVTNA